MADCCFGKRYRLLTADNFSSVFAVRHRKNRKWLQVICKNNDIGHARLGLVVGKKIAKQSNRRNYMKRVLREWFRCHKAQLHADDIVIRVHRSFTKLDCAAVWFALEQLLLNKIDTDTVA